MAICECLPAGSSAGATLSMAHGEREEGEGGTSAGILGGRFHGAPLGRGKVPGRPSPIVEFLNREGRNKASIGLVDQTSDNPKGGMMKTTKLDTFLVKNTRSLFLKIHADEELVGLGKPVKDHLK